mgnify:CR=1 FL=1
MTRSVAAPALLERFLVSAVTTVLVIRAWLAATGYPQIGGHGLHIAHMLFGGAGMLIALLMSLTLVSSRARATAALIGGIGFGAFIDELGKFITSDNNYFYRPAVALIYVIFVLLFIAGDRLGSDASPTPAERLAQAMTVIAGSVATGLPQSDRDLALRLLAQANPGDPLVPALRVALRERTTIPDSRQGFVDRVGSRVARVYGWLVSRPWFLGAVLTASTLALAFSVRELAVAVLAEPWPGHLRLEIDPTDALLLTANAIAGTLLLIGLVLLRRSRLEGFRWFRRATLVSLLVAQPLAFYEQQWTALIGLGFSLVVLSAVNYGIEREMILRDEDDADFP